MKGSANVAMNSDTVTAKLLSIIVPCFNEEGTLPATLAALKKFTIDMDIELVLVDDGSQDATRSIMLEYAASLEGKRCQVVVFSRNFGQQAAIAAGLDYCCGDRAVIIDADLQTPLTIIPVMLAASDRGNDVVDVVHAVRVVRGAKEKWKGWLANLFYLFAIHVLGSKMVSNSPDFKLLSRKAIDAIKLHNEDRLFFRGMVADLGFKQACVPYEAGARESGKSKYSLLRMLSLALTAFGSQQAEIIRFLVVATLCFDLIIALVFLMGILSVMGVVLSLLIYVQVIVVLVLMPFTLHNNKLLRRRPLYIVDQERSRVV